MRKAIKFIGHSVNSEAKQKNSVKRRLKNLFNTIACIVAGGGKGVSQYHSRIKVGLASNKTFI